MKKTVVTLLLASTMIAPLAEARRNDKREKRQDARIAEGVKSGELTKHEAKKLNKKQKKIDAAQAKASADGVVTPEEKLKLEKMQDRQSARIYKEKHDAQTPEATPSTAAPAAPADGTAQ